jgi:hypothetical protein
MSVKTTGAEFKSYYADSSAWPDGTYHDDSIIMVDGVVDENLDHNKIADSSVVTIEGGIVCKENSDGCGPSMESHFRKWKKSQNTSIFNVSIPHGKEEELTAFVKSIGGKVSK